MEERLLAYMPPGKILNNLSTKQQEKQLTVSKSNQKPYIRETLAISGKKKPLPQNEQL